MRISYKVGIFLGILGLLLVPTSRLLPWSVSGNSTYNISIVDYAFQPLHINITTGTTVTWTYSSTGQTIHSVTSDPGTNTTQSGTPLLSSGDLSPGSSYSYTFDLPGYYPYQCAVHPTITAMNGWVRVTGNPVIPTTTQNNSGSGWLIPVAIVAAAVVAILVAGIVIKRRH